MISTRNFSGCRQKPKFETRIFQGPGPHGLAVRTAPSHGAIPGSIPGGVTPESRTSAESDLSRRRGHVRIDHGHRFAATSRRQGRGFDSRFVLAEGGVMPFDSCTRKVLAVVVLLAPAALTFGPGSARGESPRRE